MDNNNQVPAHSAPPSPSPTPAPSPSKKTPSRIYLMIGGLVLVILALGGYIAVNSKKTAQPSTSQTTTSENSTETTTLTPETSSDNLTYMSEDKKWQLMYPADVTAEKREAAQIGPAGVGEVGVFYKLGPTQTSGTEFHDGLSMTVGTMQKPANTTLEKFADEQINPNPEVSTTKTAYQPLTVNGLSGVSTIVSGMGTFKMVFLTAPGNNELVYYFSILAEGADKTTYEKITNDMLQSFKLL